MVKTFLRDIHQHQLRTAGAAFIYEYAIKFFDEYLFDIILSISGNTQAEEKTYALAFKKKV